MPRKKNLAKLERIRKLAGQTDPKLTYEEIGRVINCSRQYVHQVVRGYFSPAWRKEHLNNIIINK
jgi:hypothetical protein